MRALVLILFCVFLLVVVQASYLVIEAKHTDETKTRAADVNNSTEHAHKEHSHDGSSKADRHIEHHNKMKSHKALKHLHHHGNPLVPPGEQQIQGSSVPIINMTIKAMEKSNEAKDKDIYQQMLGDAPVAESNEEGHRKDALKHKNGTKHNKKNNKSHKKGKRKRAHENTGETCAHDDDCGKGKCCVETQKGKHVCKPGAFKSMGKRCHTSCVCQEGLQCFVNTSHKLKKKKAPFHRTFGHCVDPAKAKLKTGYKLTETSASTTQNKTPSSTSIPETL